MLQRMAGFGIILKMLPARRAYPAHAGQPMAPPCAVFSPIAVPCRSAAAALPTYFAAPGFTDNRRRRFRVRSSA
jgi:hypothetical protein